MPARSTKHRVGCVSFLNARPLIDGLDHHPNLTIRYDVPSGLLDDLLTEKVELALCPVIDFQTAPRPLKVVPVGGIGCDGPTLTVRLFSRVPLQQIHRVLVDTDSHTSIVLMRVVLADRLGIRPDIVSLPPGQRAWRDAPGDQKPEAMLLIGDKVVTAAPDDQAYPHQLDLGEAWKQMTGLPFVFAVWMARAETELGDLPATLDAQRRHNADCIDTIVAQRAAAAGWPDDLAREYLGHLLRYNIGENELRAMQLFWSRAAALGFIPQLRPLCIHDTATGVPRLASGV